MKTTRKGIFSISSQNDETEVRRAVPSSATNSKEGFEKTIARIPERIKSLFTITRAIGSTTLFSFSPLSYLTDTTEFNNALDNYEYFSFDSITVLFKMRSTAFQYGSFGIVWLPYDSTVTDTERLMNTGKVEILPVETASSLEITVPWYFPLAKMRSYSVGDAQFAGGTMTFYVFPMPSIYNMNSTDPANVYIDVYAKFNGLHFSCPVHYASPASRYKNRGGVSQMMMDPQVEFPEVENVEAFSSSRPLALTAPVAAAGLAVATMPMINEGIGETIWNIFRAAEEVRKNVGKSLSFFKEEKADPETNDPDLKAPDPVCINPVGHMGAIGRGAVGDLLYETRGLGTIDPAFCGDTKVHKLLDLCRIPQLLRQAALTNVLTDLYVVPLHPIPWVQRSVHGALNQKSSFGYLSYISQFFRLWRGSLKVHWFVPLHPLAVARIRFGVTWAYATDGTTNFGDCISTDLSGEWNEIVMIKGRSSGTIVVPWTSPFPWGLTSRDDRQFHSSNACYDRAPVLFFQLLDKQTSGNNELVVPMTLMMSAGDDFCLRAYQDQPVVNGATMGQSQISLSKCFEDVVLVIEEASIGPEAQWEMPTVEHVLSRWTAVPPNFATFGGSGYPTSDSAALMEQIYPWDYWHWLFYFRRGTLSYKFITETFDSTDPNTLETAMARTIIGWDGSQNQSATPLNPGSGCVWVDNRRWNQLSVDVPYVGRNPLMWAVGRNESEDPLAGFAADHSFPMDLANSLLNMTEQEILQPECPTNTEYAYVRAGVDYQLIHLRVIPPRRCFAFYEHSSSLKGKTIESVQKSKPRIMSM